MKWISLKRRKPKKDQMVLVLVANNWVYTAKFEGDCWQINQEGGEWLARSDVTHWMKMPQYPWPE